MKCPKCGFEYKGSRLERLREFYSTVWLLISWEEALDYARNCLRNFEAENRELTDERFDVLLKRLWNESELKQKKGSSKTKSKAMAGLSKVSLGHDTTKEP